MTVINNIEIDNITYEKNEIKNAIINNEPIENKLHVIMVISNPCLFAKRYILAKEFIKRMDDEDDVVLYVVELTYDKQRFIITDKNNKRHLQINTKTPLWHKENMINVGVNKLLPKNWKAFAWIDGDIEFESATWAKDALKILNGHKDVVQLYSHCIDMNKNGYTMRVFNSFGYQFERKHQYVSNGPDFWHPGFAWACTRKAFDKMGGLYESAILGSGDNIMSMSFIGCGLKAINSESTDNYKESIVDFQKKVQKLRLGYVPGVIRHYYHGSKKNRQYSERWQILIKHSYSPELHVSSNSDGILVPTKDCPSELLDDILKYFKERNEDEEFQTVFTTKKE